MLALDLGQRIAERLAEFWFAVTIVPSSLNSMTAWARPMADTLEASVMALIFFAVISVAIFTTLIGLPSPSSTGLYDASIQISRPPFAIRLNSAAWNSPLFNADQNALYAAPPR
ncbi:hypothetical protein ABIC08_000949 [Bradyrhizobium sp. RT9b]